MRRILQRALLTTGGVLYSAASFAHPATDHHYGITQGLWHLLSQPDHLLMLLAGITLFWYIRKRTAAMRRARQKTKV